MVDTNGIVEGGRWVRIVGLQSEAGQKLNDKVAQVLRKDKAAVGRYLLSIDGLDEIDGTKGKSIKGENFVDILREELVHVCRLPAYGESSVVDVQQPKVLLYPKDHSMFTTCNPEGNCPVMAMVEVPLMIVKTKPYTDLSAWGAADNVKATYLMINPMGGIAPPQWQSNVGPVLVYRPGAKDLGFFDMRAIHSFLLNLLDKYGDGPGFNPNTWLNSRSFQHRIRQENPPADVKRMFIALDIHSMVNKRYKQLRKEGMSTIDAMAEARRELGLDRVVERDPAQQVGAMFGLG